MPWALTVGACIESARPTAVVNVDMANKRRFICLPLLLCPISERTSRGSTANQERLAGGEKILLWRRTRSRCIQSSETASIGAGNRQICQVAVRKILRIQVRLG